MNDLVHPLHYLIVQRDANTWRFKSGGNVFYNPRNVPVSLDLDALLQRFRLTVGAAMVEMFRLNGGKPGYYLINLREKQYYYCGLDWEGVRATFRSLGIGKEDPMEA
jgi:hypothetical protein